MNLEELRQHRDAILTMAENNGIGNVRVFGSVTRGNASTDSDVDFLITVNNPRPFGNVSFKLEMEALLGCRVDIVSEKFVHPRLRSIVLSEAVPL